MTARVVKWTSGHGEVDIPATSQFHNVIELACVSSAPMPKRARPEEGELRCTGNL